MMIYGKMCPMFIRVYHRGHSPHGTSTTRFKIRSKLLNCLRILSLSFEICRYYGATPTSWGPGTSWGSASGYMDPYSMEAAWSRAPPGPHSLEAQWNRPPPTQRPPERPRESASFRRQTPSPCKGRHIPFAQVHV